MQSYSKLLLVAKTCSKLAGAWKRYFSLLTLQYKR